MAKNRYQAMVFDMDGVVLDAMSLKRQLFTALFDEYPGHEAEIDAYNSDQGGVNRRAKTEHVLRNIIGVDYAPEDIEVYAKRYGELLLENMGDVPLIAGAREFLAANSVPKFINSGTDMSELGHLAEQHDIKQYFAGIYGYPLTKAEALQKVLADLSLEPTQVVFFGDMPADYQAAEATGVDFIAISPDGAMFPAGVRHVADFTDLTL